MCNSCHITASAYWPLGTIHRLTFNMRSKGDVPYCLFLNEIRDEVPTQEAIDAIFTDAHTITEEGVLAAFTPTSTILCSHREQVDRYNSLVLTSLAEQGLVGPPVVVPLSTNALQHEHMHAWLEQPNFHTLSVVALGARVMLTRNMSLKKGAANGTIGTVVGITMDPKQAGHVKRIDVKLEGVTKPLGVWRSTSKRHYDTASNTFRKSTFPLILAYAMTGHKSQGATFNGPTIVHMRSAFTPGLLYVMLSRVTRLELVKVVGRLTPAEFQPVNLAAFAPAP